MKFILNKLVKVITILFFTFSLIILFDACTFNGELNVGIKTNYFAYWSIAFLISVLFIGLIKLIDNASKKKMIVLTVVFILFFIIGQSLIVIFVDVLPFTDTMYIEAQALSIGKGLTSVADSNYFAIYSNNNMLLLIEIIIAKIFGSFGRNLVIMNMLCIDLGVFFTCMIAKEVRNNKFALKVLLLSILNPLNYLYVPYVYTTTLSLPFMVGLVYVAILLKKHINNLKKSIILSILLGIVFSLGYLLRPTQIIVLIALMLVGIFYFEKKLWKKYIVIFLCVLISISITYFGINRVLNNISVDKTRNLPITHWIMMGLHNSGQWNSYDLGYTLSYDNSQDMKKANIENIKLTLKDYGISGLIELLFKKIDTNWSSGTANYCYRLSYSNSGYRGYQFLVGEKNHFVLIYCQAFRIVTCLFLIVSIINQLGKKEYDWRFLINVVLLGAFLFYLIWEVKSLYSIPFLPFMILLMTDGIEDFYIKIKENLKIKRKLIVKIGVLLIFFTMLMFLMYQKYLAREELVYCTYNLRVPSLEACVELKEELCYEITQSKKFNKIDLHAVDLNKESDDSDVLYNFELYKNGDLIYSEKINSENFVNNVFTLNIPEQNPSGNEKYVMKFGKDDINDRDTLVLLANLVKINDDKILKIDGEIKNVTIGLDIYNVETNQYFSKKSYLLLVVLFIIMELFIIYELVKDY